MRGSLLLLFGSAAVYLVAALAIGLWISTVVETQQQAMFVTFFVMNVYLLMSGLFTPIDSMAPWVQVVSQLNPVRHFVTISRAILIKGAGPADIARPFLTLTAFGAVTLALAIRQYSTPCRTERTKDRPKPHLPRYSCPHPHCHMTDEDDAVRFQLNFKSGKPVYLQLVDQVKAAAASGAVQAGEPLPSVRALAEELRVNRNTVAKAYAELESQRVIETVAGKGCFVRATSSPFKKGRPPQAAGAGDRRGRRPGASPADREARVSQPRRRSLRRVRTEALARGAVMTPMNHEAPVIDINQLVRRYGRTDAVNGLSLRVQPGRCYGFFGRNGAGKTTTIKCLLNLLRPTSGGREGVRPGPGAR